MVCCSSNAVGIMPVRIHAKSVMSSVRRCRRTSIHNTNATNRASFPRLHTPMLTQADYRHH
jgi:hypothetical protein